MGRVAQIDHLVINRCLDIWVCESKSFAQGVAINEHGEFTRFHGRTPIGIPSPLEQNRKHIDVLKSLLESSAFRLPTRLGVAIRPNYESVVLIANGARITRPKAPVPGLDRVVHTERLRSLIERSIDEASALTMLGSTLKIVSAETLEAFARQLAALHRPIVFDWHGKFGLAPVDAMAQGATTNEATHLEIREAAPTEASAERPNREPAAAEARTTLPTPSRVPSASQTNGPAVPADPHTNRLSTSKLAAARKLGTPQMLTALVDAGYLDIEGEGHRLTAKALDAGAVRIEKSRFGPYFLWPIDFSPEPGR